MPSGITLISQPTDFGYLPAYNPNWLYASSSNFAAANFVYRVIFEDLLSGETWTEDIEPNPDDKLLIDIASYAASHMINYLPINTYGWKKCAGASRKIRYNVGEFYGAMPAYTAGTDRYYIAWNAGIDLIDERDYGAASYVYDSTTPNARWLTNTLTQKAFTDRSNLFYVLIQEGNLADVPEFEINTYTAAGVLVNSSTIARPDYTTGLYTDQYVCIDLGVKGLNGLIAGQVAGSFPVLAGTEAYYTVTDNTDALNPVVIKRYDISCQPKFTVYTLHYLKANGSYESLHFELASKESFTASQTTFKKNPYALISNVMSLDPSIDFEKSQGVTIQTKLNLLTDWLTQAEMELHADLFTSTDIKLDLGSSQGYIKVICETGGYVPRDYDLLRQIAIEVSYGHQNHRQRG